MIQKLLLFVLFLFFKFFSSNKPFFSSGKWICFFLLAFQISFGQSCNVVKTGDFTGSINATNWSAQTDVTGWHYSAAWAPNEAYIEADGVTNVSLKQSLTGLISSSLTLSFKIKGQNANRSAVCPTTATLVIKVGGTTYMTITNPVNNSQIFANATYITTSGGATYTTTGFPLTVAGASSIAITQGTITLTIPWVPATATTGDIEFVATTSNTVSGSCTAWGGDDWFLDDISVIATNPTSFNMTGTSVCAGNTTTVGLSNSQLGVNYQLQRGGVNTGSAIVGTGSAISFGVQSITGVYTVVATAGSTTCTTTMNGSVLINPNPTLTGASQSAAVCAGSGALINLTGLSANSTSTISYSINGVAQTAITGVVANASGAGSFTSAALTAANSGQTLQITGVTTTSATPNCSTSFTQNVTMAVNALPTAYAVTGGGSYCSGGTGVAVSLANSVSGINYQLQIGGVNTGSTVAGTGSAISFGLKTVAGTYTVIATNATTTCTSSMAGSVAVTINALPTAYAVTGGGSYCSGGTGVLVGLANSTSGINYQLQIGGVNTGSAVAGTGSAINFGLQTTAGTYTVVATNATTTCTSNMTGSVAVSINALPIAYAVTGGGSYCSGGTGVLVGLANSASGVNYQLQIGGVNTGSAVAGTGSAISFGLQTTAGTYTVIATNATTICTSNMTGSVAVSINALPTAYAVTGGGSYCSGGTGVLVGLANSVSGINYQLQIGGVNTGSAVAGTGSAISFGLKTVAGTYTVIATNATTTCTSNMPGSVAVSINALPTVPTIGTITNVSCSAGGSVVLNDLPSGSWTINQSGTVITSYSSNTSSYTVLGLSAGSYTFTVNNANGCSSLTTTAVPITDASSTTWNGSGWSNGTPDATKNVIITSVTPNSPFTADLSACALTINNSSGVATVPSGITLTITNEVTVATDYNLIFENNASLVQINNNATNTGKIIYKRNSAPMKNFDYTYWSSPVSGQTLFDLSPNTLADKYMSYSGTGWQISYGGTAVMQPGIGYIIRTPKGGTWPAPHPEVVAFPYSQPVQFKGVPNNGNITSSQSMVNGKFYLIGNPYPSALFADDFLSDNNTVLNGTIYLWTHNTAIVSLKYTSDDYASYNGLGGVATSGGAKPLGYVAAGQSFFASAKANGNPVFDNSMRSGGNNTQFFKPGKTAKTGKLEKHRLWLDMTNTSGAFKQTLIGYVEGATNSYDDNFDGLTFDGNSYLDLYSINGTDNLTIQGRALPFTDTDVVPLGYRSTVAGSFTISINQADGALANQRIYLEDKQTGTINELTVQNYTFSTAIGTFNNRFVLRYTNKTLGTGDFETVENQITVVSQDKTITISSPTENIDKVFIYDVSGKLLYKKQNVGNLELSIQHLAFAQQVLLVKVVLENGYTTTKKLIFK